MEISINNWPQILPVLLQEISEAHFVALDFEFSGISMEKTSTIDSDISSISSKRGLQQRYEEVRNAAVEFQVLQVGITFAVEDEDQGLYSLKSYNIHLSPVIKEELKIDRKFSFMSNSTRFLLKHGFDFAKPFNHGVPYLSRHEEAQARAIERADSNGRTTPQISLDEIDNQERAFIAQTRSHIDAWMNAMQTNTTVILRPSSFDIETQIAGGFTSRQKRLIRQLVRIEYPGLDCQCSYGNILLSKKDLVKDQEKARSRIFEAELQRQIGLRFLFEGLTANCDVDGVDVTNWMSSHEKATWSSTKRDFANDFNKVKEKLRKPTVLAGHNVFVDLVNFYACFIGPPPANLKDFQREIHKMFPLVIDTKYLASHFGGSGTDRTGLGELDDDLEYMTLPVIQYPGQNQFSKHRHHEAGYDSLMTARVAIRLSARLEAKGYYLQKPEIDCGRPDTKSSRGANLIDLESPRKKKAASSNGSPVPSAKRSRRKSSERSRNLTPSEELLEVFRDEPVKTQTFKERVVPSGKFIDHDPWLDARMELSKATPFMPSFKSDFWTTFGNRLMVRGTKEEVCLLRDPTNLPG